MRITGTFLDEITHDIPSNNWGRSEWTADVDAMGAIGIDTAILVRAGVGRIAACPSRVLAEGMAFDFGTCDPATRPARARTLDAQVELPAFLAANRERIPRYREVVDGRERATR